MRAVRWHGDHGRAPHAADGGPSDHVRRAVAVQVDQTLHLCKLLGVQLRVLSHRPGYIAQPTPATAAAVWDLHAQLPIVSIEAINEQGQMLP
jgi:hypothetical protein